MVRIWETMNAMMGTIETLMDVHQLAILNKASNAVEDL